MSENKVKLQLTRNSSLNDKSPSPTKLMLNHGKPNFIINRENNNYKKFHIDEKFKSNEIDKIVLKNVSLNVTPTVKENYNVKPKTSNEHEFLEKFKKISSKPERIDKNLSNKKNQTHKQEFLEKFQKISEKLSTRDIDAIETSSLDNTNGTCVYDIKTLKKPNTPQLKIEPQFAKMVDNRVHNAEINNSGFQLPPGAICGKPYIPAKPAGLIPTPPPILTSNGNGPFSSPTNGVNKVSTMITKNESNSQENTNGFNYEQKTIVSFSKDLSSAPNTYPDTARLVINELKSNSKQSEILNKIGNLKFDIETTANDVIVTPVIR